MKRRLFLKKGGLVATGVVAIPYLLTSCNSTSPEVLGSGSGSGSGSESSPELTAAMAEGMVIFTHGAQFLDLSIAELRISGNGAIVAASAETAETAETGAETSAETGGAETGAEVAGAETAVNLTLGGVVSHIFNSSEGQAELPAEFITQSDELIQASAEIFKSAPELSPVPTGGYAELAEDFAYLKVMKATSILHSAANVDPDNTDRAVAAENMFEAAEGIHTSLSGEVSGENSPELTGSSEQLLAFSEQYVGTCKTFSGEQSYIQGVEDFSDATSEIAEGGMATGASELMASSDNIALAVGYFADGITNLDDTAQTLGLTPANTAEELIPFSELLVTETAEYLDFATGESAVMGAETMGEGANLILAEAKAGSESDPAELTQGGQTFVTGAEEFIAGTMSHRAAEKFAHGSEKFKMGAENLAEGLAEGNAELAEVSEMGIMMSSEMLHGASEDFALSATAIEFIAENLGAEHAELGVQSLVPSTTHLLKGAELMQSVAEGRHLEASIGASEALEGAERATHGSIEASTEIQHLLEGTQSIETGSSHFLEGAIEFIEGIER